MSKYNQLKKQIVIVNQFGKRASRTPARYIGRYISREEATEGIFPATDPHSVQRYVSDYVLREEAHDKIIDGLKPHKALVRADSRVTSRSSRLFGNRGLIYTQKDLEEAIRVTEKANQSHIILLPVVSFETQFLKDQNILASDTPDEPKAGDLEGRVDHLKLRRAIRAAVSKLCEKLGIRQPEWTGAIHVNTENVHCHLTLIETSKDVPDKRFVKKARQKEDGSYERDENGKVVYDTLGERGSLTEPMKRVFRQTLERELHYMKQLTPFVNVTSPHKQLVKEKAVELVLTSQTLKQSLKQLYHVLPKRLAEHSADIDDEVALQQSQKVWRASSNRQEMKRAQQLSSQLVDRLFSEHSQTIGLDDYDGAVESYVRFRLELPSQEEEGLSNIQLSERNRLRELSRVRLKEELINAIYKTLKPIRLAPSLDYDRASQEEKPGVRELKGVEAAAGFRLQLASDQSLNGWIARMYEKDDRDVLSKQLTYEKRLRDYPTRLGYHSEFSDRFDRLLYQYHTLVKDPKLRQDTQDMETFYEFRHDYHQRLADKYHYLTYQGDTSHLRVKGRFYMAPNVSDSGETDWEQWVAFQGGVLTDRARACYKKGVKITPLTIEEQQQFYRLPYPLQKVAKGDAFKEREVLLLEQQWRAKQSRVVTKERFDRVKFDDLYHVTYDLDVGSRRDVPEEGQLVYQERMQDAVLKTENALSYLRRTGQASPQHLAYQRYKADYVQFEREYQFALNLKDDLTLPKPSVDERVSLESIQQTPLVLSDGDSDALSQELLVVSKGVVSKHKKTITQLERKLEREGSPSVDVFDSLLEQLHLQSVARRHEEEREREEKEKAWREEERQKSDALAFEADMEELLSMERLRQGEVRSSYHPSFGLEF